MFQGKHLAAIILAAGASTRVGIPKATVRSAAGSTMLEEACKPFLRIGATPLIVTGFSAHHVERLAHELGFRFVRNQTPSDGMQSSIRVGLAALEPGIELVFIHPVDCPGIAIETLELLVSTMEANRKALAAKPMYQGKGGHPVLLRRQACTMYIESGGKWNLRQFLKSLGSSVLLIDTEDRAVVRDIDTGEDVKIWVTESAR